MPSLSSGQVDEWILLAMSVCTACFQSTLFLNWACGGQCFCIHVYFPSAVGDICLLSIIICKVHMMGVFHEDVIKADVLLACINCNIVVLVMWTTLLNPRVMKKHGLTNLWTWAQKYALHDKNSEWQCILRADASLHTSQIYQVAASRCECKSDQRFSTHKSSTHTFYVRKKCPHPLYVCLGKEQFPLSLVETENCSPPGTARDEYWIPQNAGVEACEHATGSWKVLDTKPKSWTTMCCSRLVIRS